MSVMSHPARMAEPKGTRGIGYSRLPNWIFTSLMWSKWSEVAKAVYPVLCYHANQERLAYPSLRRIASFAGYSRTYVSRAVQELWKSGAIGVRRIAYRGANCYYLPLNPAKCPANLDAYLKRKAQRVQTAKRPANLDATRPANLDANKTSLNKKKEPTHVSVTIQNILTNQEPGTARTQIVERARS